jgi:hypothetical protein
MRATAYGFLIDSKSSRTTAFKRRVGVPPCVLEDSGVDACRNSTTGGEFEILL